MKPEQGPFPHQDFEPKWLKYWQDNSIYKTPDVSDRPKYYVLEMFPYPSGTLHMGHVRNYSMGDCFARYKRMKGYDVLYPMGYDSFGLPAENAAIKHGIDPEKWTLKNIEAMRHQQDALGLSYDWDSSLATCLEPYYKWNQWLFIQMVEKGLVYRKKGWVNWDPVDQTVLANEQVIDGKGWRSGAEVEKREIEQWYIKITDYAEELLTDLDTLTEWPDSVKHMQRNWIGKSTGTLITIPLVNDQDESLGSVDVFTTRPDTLFGMTYLVLAVEHPMVQNLIDGISNQDDVDQFIQATIRKSTLDRTGDQAKEGRFLHCYGINPINQEKCPLWVADYVLMDYGTGAVMAVPAHDDRDFVFANYYDLPIRTVIVPDDGVDFDQGSAFTDPGTMVDSGPFTGLSNEAAKDAITDHLIQNGQGERKTTYRLRDWLISRQRYWGTPIPMVYDEQGEPRPVPLDQLPVLLPKDVDFSGKGNPIETSPSFRHAQIDGQSFRRETDTMDTFFDSSWYFFRYCDSQNDQEMFNSDRVNHWLQVDQYIGGIEHACLHLLYARFFTKVLRDLGLTSIDEPFKRLLCQGMVIKDGAKMSKSLGNTVDPGYIIEKYGADTARLFILFGAPVDRDLDWSDQAVEGCYRFLNRVYRIVMNPDDYPLVSEHRQALKQFEHKTIQAVGQDIERFSLNTAISKLMSFVNIMHQKGCEPTALRTLIVLLAPFAPFITEELWHQLGEERSVHQQDWPSYDMALTIDDQVTMVVQVNGKVRERISVDRDLDQESCISLARKSNKVQKYLASGSCVKTIVVPNKLINFVVKI